MSETTLREKMHLKSCAVGKAKPCPKNDGAHRWSGWPGAYCLDCGADDASEWCIGTVCLCHCHKEFWESYEKAKAEGGLYGD